jgi:Phosphoribosylformimino-5-aminoimidazole carboxamide ribonucleotide (ProFAR) isomerase
MLLIPAIDIKDGRCVRLRQGRMDEETIYGENPLEMAKRWIDAGARRLHIVDLDGAIAGRPENADIIHEIAAIYPDIPIQVGVVYVMKIPFRPILMSV